MTYKDVGKEVAKAQASSSHKLRMTLKGNAVYHYLVFVLGLLKLKMIGMDNGVAEAIGAIVESRSWGQGDNRTFIIILEKKFDFKLFMQCLGDVLDKIEAI